MRLEQTRAWQRLAGAVLTCGGAQTLSKGSDRFPAEYPLYIQRGKGSHVWDVDGNEYIDYTCALGPIVLGYSHPAVNDAIRRQLRDGIVFSLEHPLTVEVAEIICDLVPCAEKVRFTKTGSDACEAALRVARTYTGRGRVISVGYHGWGNEFQATAQDARGRAGTVPSGVVEIPYNDLRTLEEQAQRGDLAAIIVEPMRQIAPGPGYLEGIREVCRQCGAVLIFDEVVTGFRWDIGGAQAYFGVTPDLCTLGKAMANGMPLGAVAGRADIMSAFDRCFVSGTYAGETLSLAAAKATLQVIEHEPVIPHIWTEGDRLQTVFNALAVTHQVPARSIGYGPLQFQTWEGPRAAELRMRWLAETAARGILFGPYTQYGHSKGDAEKTVAVMTEVMPLMATEKGERHNDA